MRILRNPWAIGLVAFALVMISAVWVLHIGADDHSEGCEACLHVHASALPSIGPEIARPDVPAHIALADTGPAALRGGPDGQAAPRGPPHS